MKVEPRDAERLLAAPPADARLYLFHGPDEGQARDLAQRLEAKFGLDRLDLAPAEVAAQPGRLADEAASVSMFGPAPCLRLVPAADAHAPAAALLLDAAFTGEAAGNPAILIAGNLPGTSKLRKLAEAHPRARALACYPPSAADFARLARDTTRAAGLDAEPAALALLTAAVGGERGLLAQEIAKLAVYLDATPAQPRKFTPADWHAVGAGEGAADIDPLIDALAARKPADVARHLRALAADGQHGIPLLRAGARRFAQLAEARAAVDSGASADAAVGALRPPLFWKAKPAFLAQLKAWRADDLAGAAHALLAAERGIKAAGSVGDLMADACLLGLAGQGGAYRRYGDGN